jgi:hypothetical protein
MTQAEKDDILLKLKCALSNKATKFNKALSINKCEDELTEDVIVASFLIDVMCRYEACCTTVIAHTIELTKGAPVNGNLQAELTVGGITLSTYIGTGDEFEILGQFNSDVNTTSISTGFASTLSGNILTLWTCEDEFSGDTPSVVETDLGIGFSVLSAVITAIPNFLTESLYNCVPMEEICVISSKTKDIIACEC